MKKNYYKLYCWQIKKTVNTLTILQNCAKFVERSLLPTVHLHVSHIITVFFLSGSISGTFSFWKFVSNRVDWLNYAKRCHQ